MTAASRHIAHYQDLSDAVLEEIARDCQHVVNQRQRTRNWELLHRQEREAAEANA